MPSDLMVVGTCSISASKHAFATLKNNHGATDIFADDNTKKNKSMQTNNLQNCEKST
jgi:hypothetical protein